jgi:hypothetical protein
MLFNTFVRKLQPAASSAARRAFSDVAKTAPSSSSISATVAAPVKAAASGGSSFLQRLSAFLAGCGVGFGTSFYFIYNELIDSNTKFERDLAALKN